MVDRFGEDQSEIKEGREMVSLLGKEEDAGRIISTRGTEEGLILRIDGRADWELIVSKLEEFLESRRNFLSGSELSLEWLDRMPTKEQSQDLIRKLREQYGIEILGRRKKPEVSVAAREGAEERGGKNIKGVTVPLFDNWTEGESGGKGKSAGPKRRGREEDSSLNYDLELGDGNRGLSLSGRESGSRQLGRMAELLGENVFYDEEANAKFVFGTLRSGTRVETPFSLLVVGDVNPGADVIAGGDIVVFGNLRGTAHASAYNDDGSERVIIALQMKPMQLRIGSVISRGSEETVRGAEIARIEDRRVVVEAFNPKVLFRRGARFS